MVVQVYHSIGYSWVHFGIRYRYITLQWYCLSFFTTTRANNVSGNEAPQASVQALFSTDTVDPTQEDGRVG